MYTLRIAGEYISDIPTRDRELLDGHVIEISIQSLVARLHLATSKDIA